MSKPEVLVFTMTGCPACAQLKPFARQMATHYGQCVDTRFVDVDRESQFADAMGIEELPTMIGVNPGKQPVCRMVGFEGPARMAKVYDQTLETAVSCSVKPFQDV
jgi:thioredoxin-like negative regulator of GroEL